MILEDKLVGLRRLYPRDSKKLMQKMNDFSHMRKHMPQKFMLESDAAEFIENEYVFAIVDKNDEILALIKDEYYNELALSGIIKVRVFNATKEQLTSGLKLFLKFCWADNYETLYLVVPEFETELLESVKECGFTQTGTYHNARIFDRKLWNDLVFEKKRNAGDI